jgi:DNA-directed RNA polymerase subunit RPC12/RpoP
MPKCSNCGRTTERTEDWACQWCGHPLLSKSYKKISKTYKQLKEKPSDVEKSDLSDEAEYFQQNENLSVTPSYTPLPEPEVSPEPEPEPDTIPEQSISIEPEKTLEPDPIPEPSISVEPEKTLEQKPPVNSESTHNPVAEPESEVIPLPAKMPEESTITETKPEPESEVIPLPAKMPEKEPEVESEIEPVTYPNQKVDTIHPSDAELNLTVEELLFAYTEDNVAANARYIDKRLKITGTIDKIEVKDYLDIYYISLNNTERNSLQTVRCIFDKKDMDDLNKLLPGQKVIVSGKFDGSIIDFRMSECILVG